MRNYESPAQSRYDVVIVGGAAMGSSVAWFLKKYLGFEGSVLVVERDPAYQFASTSHTNSCMRQQFSTEINVRVSQFAARFVRNFREYMGEDPRVPELAFHCFGYMYLANNQAFASVLSECQKTQSRLGAGTRMLTPEQINREYPFYNLDDIVAGSLNLIDEGYFDGSTLFDWWKRSAREQGAQYIANEVVGMTLKAQGANVDSVTLATGQSVACGFVVNTSGPRAALTARMAGIDIPVEPRKRYTYIFKAERPLERDLPLTVDPSGVHVRTEGSYYMAGCPPPIDVAVDCDDFGEDHALWEELVWPALAARIPQFESIKLLNSWVGHYAFNTLDQNAILGRHDCVENFIFACGFSGHGMQQSPAMGRAVAELINFGEYRTLDLSDFGYHRVVANAPLVESAVI